MVEEVPSPSPGPGEGGRGGGKEGEKRKWLEKVIHFPGIRKWKEGGGVGVWTRVGKIK